MRYEDQLDGPGVVWIVTNPVLRFTEAVFTKRVAAEHRAVELATQMGYGIDVTPYTLDSPNGLGQGKIFRGGTGGHV